MTHQVPAGVGAGRVLAGPYDDVAAHRERPRAKQPRPSPWRCSFMNSDVAEVRADAPFVPLTLVMA